MSVVSTLDLVFLIKLITGEATSFSNSDSWEYLHADTQPLDPMNPWSNLNYVPLSVENLAADVTMDIIAIKIGDLDNSSLADYKTISGTFFNDLNDNCQNDDTAGLPPNWGVELEGTTNYLQVVDEDGNFVIIAPSGDYNVLVNAPNEYWESCQTSYPVTIDKRYLR
ncbi:MAG: hypothetical protein ACI9XO_004242 [Paraglaciecola sp.]|jgi:hypothetical protein